MIKLKKLQKIQNHGARLVKKISKSEHIDPILKQLHWLPIKSRINYKIATLTYQCVNDPSFPPYLKDLVHLYKPARELRSQNKSMMYKPRVHFKNYGERSFNYTGPDVWNSLPQSLLSAESLSIFKNMTKTWLFT